MATVAATTIQVDKDPRYYTMGTEMRDAGCPPDQFRRFVDTGYFPLSKMQRFHAAARLADRSDGPDEIALGGTRYNGKTHAIMAQVGLDDCQRVPGSKWLFLRKVQKSAAESFEDVVSKVFRYTKHTYKEGRVDFPNGSRIMIGGFNNETDIDKYLGIEYDGLAGEEITQLSQNKIEAIYGSIRSSIPGWRVRKYLGFNPGGVGYAYIKQKFVIPWREQQEKWTRFFFCHWKDNPLAAPEYIHYLQGLTGPLAKAWRDGDLDAFEGMALPDWNADVHIILPFEIPPGWTRWRAVDYGFVHPFVCGWLAKDPATGRIIVYRVISHQFLADRLQAATIQENTTPMEKIQITYASPDMWHRKADKDGRITTPADNYKDAGVVLTMADDDRINGKRKLHSVMADLPDGKPGLQVFSTCTPLIECLPGLISDPHNPEDVLKVDCDPATGLGGDDPYDMLRYGLTNTRLAQPPTRSTAQRYNPLAGANF